MEREFERYCEQVMKSMHILLALIIIGLHEQIWPSLSGRRPCEVIPGPTARPQYLQIVLFSCLLYSELTN